MSVEGPGKNVAGAGEAPEHDAYRGFAERYDLFFGQFEAVSPQLSAFFQQVFDRNSVRRVLDCACGTGRHLYLFHKMGFEVAGSDISASMLARAGENLGTRGIHVPLHRVDYRELPVHFGEKFDAVVCLTSAICEMPGPEEILRALKSMHGVLRPGGVLVMSQGTTDSQWQRKPRFILVDDTPAFTRLFVVDYCEKGARYNVVDIFHGAEGGEVKSWGVDYPHILFRDGQERLLESAGFSEVQFFGSYKPEPYSRETSNHLITVARA